MTKVSDPLARVKASPTTVTHLKLGATKGDLPPAFPDEIFACTNLVELEIFRGIAAHSKIPRELGTLRKLTALSLGGLGFKQLPDELGELEHLETLTLAYTESLVTLPKTIGKLAKLRAISAPHTGMKTLPPELGQLGQLRVLEISHAPMVEVPAELWGATQLETLVLPAGIERLPPGIGALTKLTALAVSARALGSIAGELGLLRGLRTLHLLGTATQLPDEIGELRALEELHANQIELAALPATLGKLGKLAILDVGGNKLATLIDLVAKLPALTELVSGGNPIPVAERRELATLMKLSPARRAAALAKRSPPPKAAKPAAKRPVRVAAAALVGEVTGVALLVGDSRVVARWRGRGADAPEGSDWDRARAALIRREAAMIDVVDHAALAMALGVGHGVVRVFRIADRIIGVESFAPDPDDELFLAWVASPSTKPRSAAILAIPSGKLAIIPTTEPGGRGLVVPVAAKVAIAIEPAANGAWGMARRCFVTPA